MPTYAAVNARASRAIRRRITTALLKIAAVAIMLIAVAVAAVYIAGQFEQTRPFHDQIMGYVDQAKTWLTENWAVTTASIGGIVTVGGAALSQINKYKSQATQLKDAAESKISSLTNEKDKLAETLSGYESQAKSQVEGYEAQIAGLKKQLDESSVDADAINKLKQQLQGAQDMHNNFVAQLTSGSQQVIDPATNQVYKLITLEKTVVK